MKCLLLVNIRASYIFLRGKPLVNFRHAPNGVSQRMCSVERQVERLLVHSSNWGARFYYPGRGGRMSSFLLDCPAFGQPVLCPLLDVGCRFVLLLKDCKVRMTNLTNFK